MSQSRARLYTLSEKEKMEMAEATERVRDMLVAVRQQLLLRTAYRAYDKYAQQPVHD